MHVLLTYSKMSWSIASFIVFVWICSITLLTPDVTGVFIQNIAYNFGWSGVLEVSGRHNILLMATIITAFTQIFAISFSQPQ